MSEAYSSGAWTLKDGEDDAFVEAWTEFACWLITISGAGTARLTRNLCEPRRYGTTSGPSRVESAAPAEPASA